MTPTLSNDLKVACEIYKINHNGDKVWFKKLVDVMSNHMTKVEVSCALDTLSDWGIVEGHYDATEKGRAGYLFNIQEIHMDRIKELYERHWK